MADNSQLFPSDPDFTLNDSDAKALLAGQRQQLTSQFPYLAGNAEFNRDLDDAFNSFINQSTQRGADYNNVWSKTFQPVVAKWQAQGAALPKLEQVRGWQDIAAGDDPATVAKNNPLWLTSSGAQTLLREKAVKNSASPKLSLQQSDTHAMLLKDLTDARSAEQASDSNVNQTAVQSASDALKQFDLAVQPALAPSAGLSASRISPIGITPAMTPPPSYGSPVAAPQGTSGFVNPAGGNPKPIIYMGPQLSPQAEAQMGFRIPPTGNTPAVAPSPLPATPPDTNNIAPVNSAPALRPIQRPAENTLQNSGVLGVAASRVASALSLGPFLIRNASTLRAYVAAHPDMDADTKKQLLREAQADEGAPSLTYDNTIKPALQNVATTGSLIKDLLVGQNEAPLPLPKKVATTALIQQGLPPVRPPSVQPPAQPKTQQEFAALPIGALYINPADGKLYQKK